MGDPRRPRTVIEPVDTLPSTTDGLRTMIREKGFAATMKKVPKSVEVAREWGKEEAGEEDEAGSEEVAGRAVEIRTRTRGLGAHVYMTVWCARAFHAPQAGCTSRCAHRSFA